jgi:glucokinase
MGGPIVAGVLGRQPRPVSPFLAADLGGTHARVGLVVPDAVTGKPDIVLYQVYRWCWRVQDSSNTAW